jgi:hypothetical protein
MSSGLWFLAGIRRPFLDPDAHSRWITQKGETQYVDAIWRLLQLAAENHAIAAGRVLTGRDIPRHANASSGAKLVKWAASQIVPARIDNIGAAKARYNDLRRTGEATWCERCGRDTPSPDAPADPSLPDRQRKICQCTCSASTKTQW